MHDEGWSAGEGCSLLVAACLVASPGKTVHAAVLLVRCCANDWKHAAPGYGERRAARGMPLLVCVTVVLAICAESSIGLAHRWVLAFRV